MQTTSPHKYVFPSHRFSYSLRFQIPIPFICTLVKLHRSLPSVTSLSATTTTFCLCILFVTNKCNWNLFDFSLSPTRKTFRLHWHRIVTISPQFFACSLFLQKSSSSVKCSFRKFCASFLCLSFILSLLSMHPSHHENSGIRRTDANSFLGPKSDGTKCTKLSALLFN